MSDNTNSSNSIIKKVYSLHEEQVYFVHTADNLYQIIPFDSGVGGTTQQQRRSRTPPPAGGKKKVLTEVGMARQQFGMLLSLIKKNDGISSRVEASLDKWVGVIKDEDFLFTRIKEAGLGPVLQKKVVTIMKGSLK